MSPLPASCARVQTRVAERTDGALSALEEARDRGHLEACAACQAEHERHLALLRAIRTAPAELVADAARVAAVVRARTDPLRRPRRLPRSVPAALLAAAAAVLLLFLVATRAPGLAPAADGQRLAALEGVLEHLPSWDDLIHGLDHLRRVLS